MRARSNGSLFLQRLDGPAGPFALIGVLVGLAVRGVALTAHALNEPVYADEADIVDLYYSRIALDVPMAAIVVDAEGDM